MWITCLQMLLTLRYGTIKSVHESVFSNSDYIFLQSISLPPPKWGPQKRVDGAMIFIGKDATKRQQPEQMIVESDLKLMTLERPYQGIHTTTDHHDRSTNLAGFERWQTVRRRKMRLVLEHGR